MKTVSIKFLGFPHLSVFVDGEISVETDGIARVSEEKAEVLLEDSPGAWEIVDRKGRPKADQKMIQALEAKLTEAEQAVAAYAADNEVLEAKLAKAELEIESLKAQEIAEGDIKEE